MNRQGFEQALRARRLTEEQINQHIGIVERFDAFLKAAQPPLQLDQATADAARAFAAVLIEEGLGTEDNLLALARYALFAKNNAVLVVFLGLVDGSEVMARMHHKVGQVVGEQKRDQVFENVALPPLGTPNLQKARITRLVMERLECLVDAETREQIFVDSFRDLPDSHYQEDRERYLACGDLDEFLEMKRQQSIAHLEQIRDEGRLFFDQEITDEVLAFVRENPEIAEGVRRGNILYVTKIPYRTKEYLAEADEDKKRYYYCHCPWARESLREGEARVSAAFCQCSAGYHKKPWEVILGQPIKAEVLESVLKGDLRCRFALHLPLEG